MTQEDLFEILERAGCAPRGSVALCPVHADTRPSLSFKVTDEGKVLLYCFAGCEFREIAEALQLEDTGPSAGRSAGETLVDTYVYTNEAGWPLIRVSRYEPKSFGQERWEDNEWKPGLRDTRRVLYRLPELLAGIESGETVYITEGEKDAESLVAAGACATAYCGGSKSWRDEYVEHLDGARAVVVVADHDDAGREGAGRVRASLERAGIPVTVVLPAHGKDATDHLRAGLGIGDFLAEDDTFEEWDPWAYEPPVDEWLFKPWVPRASRVLLHGPSGSLKSLWAMWLGYKLALQGSRVAFISTEMNKGQTAKRARQLGPAVAGFKTYGRFMMGQNLETAIKNFEGWDLIIVDSWSSTQGDTSSNDNDAIALMDKEFFQPLVQATGATLLIIDNTGHDSITNDGAIKRDTARGASRKRDIQEVELFFSRPEKGNNFRCRIECTKMRLDIPMPQPVVVQTTEGAIDFRYVVGGVMDKPMWPGDQVETETHADPEPEPEPAPDPMRALRAARAKDSSRKHEASMTPEELEALETLRGWASDL